MQDFNIYIFILGCIGGLVPELIRFTKKYSEVRQRGYLKDYKYYINVIILCLLGGLIAWLLDAEDKLQAVLYGFSAPEIFSRLASKENTNTREPNANVVPIAKRSFSMRYWWS